MFLEPEPESEGRVVARAPGERDEATQVGPPPQPAGFDSPRAEPLPPPVLTPVGEVACPRCGYPNPPTRVRCQRCGHELRPPEPVAPLPPLPPPARSGVPWLWLAVIGVVAVLAVAAAGFLLVNHFWGDDSGTAEAPAQETLVRVDPASVHATASSTSPDPAQYGVANTLDGNRATAWHSFGEEEASVGVHLTYRFARPVRLARITMVNGFARSPTDYRNNQRVARFAVRTEAGSRDWALRDTADPQTFDLDAAPTTSVVLTVEAVYPGAVYKDVTVTEIAFDERL